MGTGRTHYSRPATLKPCERQKSVHMAYVIAPSPLKAPVRTRFWTESAYLINGASRQCLHRQRARKSAGQRTQLPSDDQPLRFRTG